MESPGADERVRQCRSAPFAVRTSLERHQNKNQPASFGPDAQGLAKTGLRRGCLYGRIVDVTLARRRLHPVHTSATDATSSPDTDLFATAFGGQSRVFFRNPSREIWRMRAARFTSCPNGRRGTLQSPSSASRRGCRGRARSERGSAPHHSQATVETGLIVMNSLDSDIAVRLAGRIALAWSCP